MDFFWVQNDNFKLFGNFRVGTTDFAPLYWVFFPLLVVESGTMQFFYAMIFI